MNNLPDISILKNTYYGLRHGESQANVAGIIVSIPRIGTYNYGLTPNGIEQVRESVGKMELTGIEPLIISSDFRRTRETADVAAEVLGLPKNKVLFDPRLQERRFGDLENYTTRAYAKIWEQDYNNPDHEMRHVESVNSVLDRVTLVVYDTERNYTGRNIILVSHGDPLQILQTGFMGISPGEHKHNVPFLQSGEIRRLN
jgi:glucosyl-3-phosphoglycerate phosphatase